MGLPVISLPDNANTGVKIQYQKALDGDLEAQYRFGRQLWYGHYVEKSIPHSVEFIRSAAEQGHLEAQKFLAHWYYPENYPWKEYEAGNYLKDADELLKWSRIAGENGDCESYCQLVQIYEAGKYVPQDYSKAFDILKRMADLGYLEAFSRIGDYYYNGLGVEKSYDEALKWYLDAANMNDALAMFNIGKMYEQGIGVNQDYSEAISWYNKSLDECYMHKNGLQFQPDVLFSLGRLYVVGLGVDQDIEKGLGYYMNAESFGYGKAYVEIGCLYEQGTGVQQSYEEAMKWYLKAADRGHIGIRYHIADLYEQGLGVEKSLEKANEWHEAADESMKTFNEFLNDHC